ncbi:amidohydrolase family protein [Ammoniphilus sp. YIM 78166]|uniref:amidohydrolase family protein n=1 Tax=Ammoniphilus sp. YIM 78166 TaxID=1644106 RepID=UPI00106F11BF|nr:amidohydrolase family protein [Ammoniphilus sp. YIM 78166]
MIIDTHCHLGVSKFSGVDTTEEDLIRAMDWNGVQASLVMPQPTLEDISEVHRRIYRASQSYPGRIFGMSSTDPWLDEDSYRNEVNACLSDYGFVALKLHPMGHNISPLSPRCDKIYEMALEHKVPVIVHTGIGNPFSLPSLLIDPAKRYPDVTFILAHAGFAVYTDEAVVAAKYCENIILEPSWCPTYTVRKMVNTIGAERILMGSDHASNLSVELAKFHSIGLSERELEQIFYENPKRIFKLEL